MVRRRGLTPAIGTIAPNGQITEFPIALDGGNAGSFPSGIAAGPDGNLWFTDSGTTPAIGMITPGGHVHEFPISTGGGNSGSIPEQIAAGPDGNMWFTDSGTTPAIGRVTPSGQITEFSAGLQASAQSEPVGIAAGPDGNLWFTDDGLTSAVGRISPSGQITEFSDGLQPSDGSAPSGISAGPDGDLWFADAGTTPAIGRIGAGVPAAVVRAPSVTGSGEQGTQQVCQGDQWSPWDSLAPAPDLYPFDGFQWLLGGSPISGQTAQTYTPVAGDVGQQLRCAVTVSYPLLNVTASATSRAVTVTAVSTGPLGPAGPTGAPGIAGPRGSAGEIELVTCTTTTKTVKVHGKKKKRTVKKCTTRQVKSPVKFTTQVVRATLSRGHTIFATGTAAIVRGRSRLELHAVRSLARGRYTLTLARGRRVSHTTIEIA